MTSLGKATVFFVFVGLGGALALIIMQRLQDDDSQLWPEE